MFIYTSLVCLQRFEIVEEKSADKIIIKKNTDDENYNNVQNNQNDLGICSKLPKLLK